jgi:hypothetical protein
VAVHELDGILDREDVVGARAVDLVDDRGERRRLTRAGRPGDEDETAGLLRQLVEAVREAELLERLDLLGDLAERGAEGLALEIDVDAEARDAGDVVGEIDLAIDLQVLLLLAGEDAIEQCLRRLGVEGVEAVEALEMSADTHSRRRPDRDMQVGSTH